MKQTTDTKASKRQFYLNFQNTNNVFVNVLSDGYEDCPELKEYINTVLLPYYEQCDEAKQSMVRLLLRAMTLEETIAPITKLTNLVDNNKAYLQYLPQSIREGIAYFIMTKDVSTYNYKKMKQLQKPIKQLAKNWETEYPVNYDDALTPLFFVGYGQEYLYDNYRESHYQDYIKISYAFIEMIKSCQATKNNQMEK